MRETNRHEKNRDTTVVTNAPMRRSGFRKWRAARERGESRVANVLEIFDADFAGVKAVAGHLAKMRKESDALGERRIGHGVFAIGDEVESFFLLRGGGIEEGGTVLVGAEIVKPHEAAAECKLVVFVFAGEEIDELGCAGFNRSARRIVLGNNGVAEEDECGVLVRGKNLGVYFPAGDAAFAS